MGGFRVMDNDDGRRHSIEYGGQVLGASVHDVHSPEEPSPTSSELPSLLPAQQS